jgi:cytochrome P450
MQNANLADLQTTIAVLRDRFSADFEQTYVEHVIIPSVLANIYGGERLFVPMIDIQLTKENALSYHLLGLLYENLKATPEYGVTVFLQALEKRGPDNRRKRIYMSALTPDLYATMYRDKVVRFFDKILHVSGAGKPLMGRYLERYFELFWDLHLGIDSDALPAKVREFAQSFHAVLAYQDPTQKTVYENYMTVRSRLAAMKQWIDDRICDVVHEKIPNPDRTFAYWWMRNSGDGEYFSRTDAVLEVLHNFMAISQWGNMIYEIILKLAVESGDSEIRLWFKKTMKSDHNDASGDTFTALARFVMELFRTISPNRGSLSALEETGSRPYQTFSYVITPHLATSFYPGHWKQPDRFDPDRFKEVPTSHQIDEARCEQMGFAKCPFERTAFHVRDGRNVAMHNSGFGAVYPVVDGRPLPVCDHAGFAPFGFGYRRCPAEQFTIQVFEDFLRKVWKGRIEFKKLDIANPRLVPIGPGMVVSDDIAFISAT